MKSNLEKKLFKNFNKNNYFVEKKLESLLPKENKFDFNSSINLYERVDPKNKIPFKADKNHLHHVFLKKGFSHKQSTAIILLYSLFVMLTAHYFSYLSINYHLLVVSLIAIFSLILALKVKPKR